MWHSKISRDHELIDAVDESSAELDTSRSCWRKLRWKQLKRSVGLNCTNVEFRDRDTHDAALRCALCTTDNELLKIEKLTIPSMPKLLRLSTHSFFILYAEYSATMMVHTTYSTLSLSKSLFVRTLFKKYCLKISDKR